MTRRQDPDQRDDRGRLDEPDDKELAPATPRRQEQGQAHSCGADLLPHADRQREVTVGLEGVTEQKRHQRGADRHNQDHVDGGERHHRPAELTRERETGPRRERDRACDRRQPRQGDRRREQREWGEDRLCRPQPSDRRGAERLVDDDRDRRIGSRVVDALEAEPA